ncbi:MAG: excinuclease ABC subunit UvrC [Candidatus Methanofastidiosa archaeon]|nr:excinuclease ABC subunit UvrC [Candidatus Methanofastidiosa archaeon]
MIDLDRVPDEPGCYLFRDAHDIVIYVGKAKSLKKRVRSYFQTKEHDQKTQHLVQDISSLDFFVTANEVEALVLENNLIKKHQPRYNVMLKDSQRYAYIHVTAERYPRLLVARDRAGKGTYYGPFVSAEQRDNVLKALRTAFGIRTCRTFRSRPCLRYHIGLCSAPCGGMVTREAYLERVHRAERYLRGSTAELVTALKGEMGVSASSQHYERALALRDQIRALSALDERQNMERSRRHDEDVVNMSTREGTAYAMVFTVERGMVIGKCEYVFEEREGALDTFVKQYYATHPPPREVILPAPLVDEAIGPYLSQLRGSPVRVVVPKRGKKRELLDLVTKNIEARFFMQRDMVEDLGTSLRLPTLPRVIECFDISHTGGTYTVASMVQFRDGSPDKSGYRRYRLGTVEGVDDYAAMNEAVGRRYRRLQSEGAPLPDLVVVDGGKGQLAAAREALASAGVRLPVIALAKREEEVFVPGLPDPVTLGRTSKALKLLIQIRDEAHRFAVAYHTLLRDKGMIRDGA